MSQNERLSSLGRLSTVIAHEVRNPLMIIKAALHTLRQPDVSPTALREAVADIDDEVVRLNRIVNDVLDFARPIRFELAPADVNASAASRRRRRRPRPAPRSSSTSIRSVPHRDHRRRAAAHRAGQSDRERAARGRRPVRRSASRSPRDDEGACRSSIVIADRGAGIARADLPRVFDPYFTTKRGGTGLGLPIAKNIVEGLGGTIAVASEPARGHRNPHRAARSTSSSDNAGRRPSTCRSGRPSPDDAAAAPSCSSTTKKRSSRRWAARCATRATRWSRRRSPREAQRLLAERSFDLLLVDNVMPQLSGLDLIREYVGVHARRRAAADPDDDRACHGRERDRGDEARRARLPAEAVRDRRAAGRGPPGARSSAAAQRVPLPAQRARRAVRPLRHHRPQPR